MNEKDWYEKGEKRGIPYSYEELLLKYRQNKRGIRYAFAGICAVIGFLVWLIYFWEASLLRLKG